MSTTRTPSRPRLLQAMVDAFSLPDLRKRILFTIGILVLFRLIAHVGDGYLHPVLLFDSSVPDQLRRALNLRDEIFAACGACDGRICGELGLDQSRDIVCRGGRRARRRKSRPASRSG